MVALQKEIVQLLGPLKVLLKRHFIFICIDVCDLLLVLMCLGPQLLPQRWGESGGDEQRAALLRQQRGVWAPPQRRQTWVMTSEGFRGPPFTKRPCWMGGGKGWMGRVNCWMGRAKGWMGRNECWIGGPKVWMGGD
jgi:hypothetical protein